MGEPFPVLEGRGVNSDERPSLCASQLAAQQSSPSGFGVRRDPRKNVGFPPGFANQPPVVRINRAGMALLLKLEKIGVERPAARCALLRDRFLAPTLPESWG